MGTINLGLLYTGHGEIVISPKDYEIVSFSYLREGREKGGIVEICLEDVHLKQFSFVFFGAGKDFWEVLSGRMDLKVVNNKYRGYEHKKSISVVSTDVDGSYRVLFNCDSVAMRE